VFGGEAAVLKQFCVVASLLVLTACGDPLAGLTRISEVDLAETDPVANAVPTDAEVAREGFFGSSDVEPVATGDAVVAATAGPAPKGIWGLLRRSGSAAGAAQVPDEQSGIKDVADPNSGTDALLDVEDATVVDQQEPVQLASLEPAAPKRRFGLFGGVAPGALTSTTSDDVDDVAYGTVLPYGQIARSCEARRKPLGRKIESASAQGYKLYDSDPGTLGPRTYYITGFDDDCPRQLTAANVILGAPSRYEELHYGPTGRDLAYAQTDMAYDKVKQKVCGTRKGKPCGAKINQMDKTTFFVSSYATFDASARWSEVLIHDGIVMATAMKSYK